MNFIKNLFGKPVTKSSEGSIVLGFGKHEVIINLDDTPCKVSLCIKTPCDCVPVCHGDVNKIAVVIVATGFVLYVDIKTNTCCVDWRCDV